MLYFVVVSVQSLHWFERLSCSPYMLYSVVESVQSLHGVQGLSCLFYALCPALVSAQSLQRFQRLSCYYYFRTLIDHSVAKTVIKRFYAKKWKHVAKPPMAKFKARFVSISKEPDLRIRERVELGRLRSGGMTPKLAWYRHWIIENKLEEERYSELCPQCLATEETVDHMLIQCTATEAARIKAFAGQDPWLQLFDNPTAVMQYMREIGYFADRI